MRPAQQRLAAVLAVAGALNMTGCTTEEVVTLTQSKSEVQLLRVAMTQDIPAEYVSEVVRPSDIAQDCDSGDPYLRWVSSESVRFAYDFAGEVVAVRQDLIKSFVGQGWEEHAVSETESTLSSPSSIATITISSELETVPTSVEILVTGPCVKTDGRDSSSVQQLVKS